MNYKDRINGGFAGCRLLAYAYDNCRQREVRLFMLPESDEVIGVADGTDAWIAPVSASLFSVNVARLIADGRAGKGWPKPVPPVNGARSGRRVLISTEPAVVTPPADVKPFRRVLVALEESPAIQKIRSRRVIL